MIVLIAGVVAVLVGCTALVLILAANAITLDDGPAACHCRQHTVLPGDTVFDFMPPEPVAHTDIICGPIREFIPPEKP